jgi:hypothetical protein
MIEKDDLLEGRRLHFAVIPEEQSRLGEAVRLPCGDVRLVRADG